MGAYLGPSKSIRIANGRGHIYTLCPKTPIQPEPELIKLIKPNMFGPRQSPLSMPNLNNLLHREQTMATSNGKLDGGQTPRVNNLIGEASENNVQLKAEPKLMK